MSKTEDKKISADEVIAFLNDNPDFLMQHGDAQSLTKSTPDGRILNLGQAITQRAQNALKKSASLKKTLLDITTANHETQQRIHHLALLIVAAQNLDEIASLIRDTLPQILNIQAATLVADNNLKISKHSKIIDLDKTFLPKLTGGKESDLGPPQGLKAEIFRNITKTQPKSTAFIFLPPILPKQQHNIILAMAANKKDSFTEGHGTDFLKFIAAMIAVALVARNYETA